MRIFSTARVGSGSLAVLIGAAGAVMTTQATVLAQSAARRESDLHQGRRADPPALLPACHRPGSVAPMSLLTYQDARPWARSIKQKVVAREMPPWHIDRNVGITKFKDDPSLSDAEIATIAKWVDAGAPHGQPGRHAAAAPVQRSRLPGSSASPTSS